MGQLLGVFYNFIPNYGVGIILLTVTVRVAMIPLAVKQAHMMIGQRANAEKMKKIQPELKKLKEKHKDDRAKLYEEQKKLYDHHGVNALSSLAGCLPTLLQMPIFMAMYQVLRGCPKLISQAGCRPERFIPKSNALHEAIRASRATFLSMNLNFKPSGVLKAGGLPDAWPYYLLCVVMGLTMWYQTKLMTASQPMDPQMAQTQKIMQFMPLLLVFASLNFPIGLTLYWASTNIWTIGQQYLLLKKYGPQAQTAKSSPAATTGTQVALADNGSPSPNGEAKVPKPAHTKSNIAKTNGAKPGGTPPGAGKAKGSGARRNKKKKGRRR
ncbi:MAG: YidC/Oxa1 family membrane protein insertase [Actinomycetota bacterium]